MNIKKTSKGFTLVEMLVVIGIIAVLVSLMVPGANKARKAAMRMSASAEVSGIDIAIRQFYSDYSYYPDQSSSGDLDYTGDAVLVDILRGHDTTENPRGIVYLEIEDDDLGGGGELIDPWENEYVILADGNFDNEVNVPTYGVVSKPVAVMSTGPNGAADTPGEKSNDDVRTW